MPISLLLLLGGTLAVVAILVTVLQRKGTPPPEPPVPTSLSVLAGFSFFSGLAAILLVTLTGVFSLALSMSDVLHMDADVRAGLDLAAKIILYASVIPAVAAVAFALGARGVISESRGAVRGRPLYRTGMLMSVVAGALVLQTWPEFSLKGLAHVQRKTARTYGEIDRGYLGIEHDSSEGSYGTRVTRVIPGSPAEKAGLVVGDHLVELDGKPVRGEELAERIGALKPGTSVTLVVVRGNLRVTSNAVLIPPFASLLALVEDQPGDLDRLALLKAAGVDRRYTVAELQQICAAFDTDLWRLEAIQSSLPHLQDPQNAYQLVNSVESPSSKNQVSTWIVNLSRKKK